ncbi:putative cyclin-dependent serine/threonine-protein kinase DDB_G0272797/DDB_G0274007 [Drosophila santomea]|uniref:putative cyclin-dependent serine/threonine-protein kinase DDB_G0272797/DDB_G0274007 n=1 Tax=Drosophila santomea TaxID=129105 RepID=UPI001954240B|nr:putative cyclin-dependent serine/threonine-protein kinase DDB_G0272797/DDB_G0274007 [Drosophila santomea]
MYPNWLVLLHLPLVCLGVGSQIFAQPLTKHHNTGSSILSINRAEGQKIEQAALLQHLQQITGSEALAPLLHELLGQTVPNWQQPQQQQKQQQLYQQQQPKQQQQQATNQPQREQRQHFFVYENAAGQPPQILAGFNGVNVQPEQPGLQLRLQPKPIQTAQQYGGVGPKVVKAPPAAAAVWAPRVESHPPPSPSAATAAPASCQLSSNPSEIAAAASSLTATPPALCPPSAGGQKTIPLLSATALKATAG